jgi:CTP synthase
VFEAESEALRQLEGVHGILVPGGFGERGSEGMIEAARFARERQVPYFGVCLGLQMAVIETARHSAKLTGAGSTEFGACEHPVIGLLTEWMRGNEVEQRSADNDLGGTMRLGAYDAVLDPESHVAAIYGHTQISERHRHRYEVNIAYRDTLEAAGLHFSGMSPDGLLPEIVEITDHPWFIGVQFHPELKSRPFEPHPLFTDFVRAAVHQSRLV